MLSTLVLYAVAVVGLLIVAAMFYRSSTVFNTNGQVSSEFKVVVFMFASCLVVQLMAGLHAGEISIGESEASIVRQMIASTGYVGVAYIVGRSYIKACKR